MHSVSRLSVVAIVCCVILFGGYQSGHCAAAEAKPLDIAKVWSGHPVGFAFLTKGDRQYIIYYDENRRMTIAERKLNSNKWDYQVLPETVGWDSHNYIVMAIDDEGYLHLSGNMHCKPLVYYRSAKPYDIHSIERIPHMTGERENSVTYPKFFRGPANEFIYTYRDGRSGQGDQIYNVYDLKTKTWRRLLDKPLMDGQGKMNAYIIGPINGPDGYFHFVWVWRDTPDSSTNHDLSYARSKDMIHWETVNGKSIMLPITLQTPGIIVDSVPVKGGLINGNTRIGFDSKGKLVLTYQKYDPNGNNQIYNARFEDGKWKIYQTTDWNYHWAFDKGGSIHFEIRVYPVALSNGILTQQYSHDKYGEGIWKLDEKTLRPIGKIEKTEIWPKSLNKPESDYPGIQVKLQASEGKGSKASVRYMLRWETLGQNRDQPRDKVPPPSMLRLYEFSSNSSEVAEP